MSMFKQFKTDADLESGGIWVDYGEFQVRIARSGGANKNYQKTLEKKTAPVRRAIDTGVLPREKLEGILMETFAESVVLDWEIGSDGDRRRGVEMEDGEIVDPSPAAYLKVFKALPDLFWDLNEQAGKLAVFRRQVQDEEAKN